MPHLFKPTYTRTVPACATIRTIRGRRVACWTLRGGREVKAAISKDGKRCTVIGPRWRGNYRDHRGLEVEVMLFEDKEASWRRLLDLSRTSRDVASGNVSAASARRGDRAISELLDEWGKAVKDGGATDKQAGQGVHRVSATCLAAGIVRPGDMTASKVSAALADFRRDGVPRTAENQQRPKPLSARTSNHYLAACRAFGLWCVRSGYLDADPLVGASGVPVDGAETFERRALTVEELDRLMAGAAARPSRCGLSGVGRAFVYLTAFYTGLRLNELAALMPEDFRLAGDTPCIVLHGRHTKNGKDARQYLPAHAASALRAYLRGKPSKRPVWGHARNFFAGLKATNVLRLDLAAAGIPFETADGRVDFHALRASYVTALAIAGVPVAHAQRMARHSDPRLTLRTYARLTDADLAAQAAKLPKAKGASN